MAITRQQTQVFNQPVRVVRAESGAAAPEALARMASNISDIAFQEAAVYAEEVGKKAGLARATSDIVSIDPETGEPVAYKAPKGFGTIASRAYQNMIDRRFEESIISEMKKRGSEIASNSKNADEYRDRMASYIESMHGSAKNDKGEDSYYVRLIKEQGATYLSSTYTTLRSKEIASAKAALVNQQQMAGYQARVEISKLIASGASEQEVSARIDAEIQRNNELFLSKNVSFSTWKSTQETLTGLVGMNSSNQLSQIYAALDESKRAQVTLAIQNPALAVETGKRLGIDDLPRHIINAKIGSSTSSLVSALKSIGESADAVVDTSVDNIVGYNASSIGPNTTGADIDAMVASEQNDTIRALARSELQAQYLQVQLDSAAANATDLDRFTNELQSAVPNLNVFSEIVGGQRGQEVKRMIQGMTMDQRAELAKNLSDRRAEFDRLERVEDAQTEQTFRIQTRQLENSQDLLGDYDKLASDIEASGLSNTDTLLGNLREKFAIEAMDQSGNYQIESLDRYRIIASNLDNDNFQPKDANERAVWNLLRKSYDAVPTSTDRFIKDRISNWEERNKIVAESVFVSSMEASMVAGQSINTADLEEFDKAIVGDRVINAANMQTIPMIQRSIDLGYVLPSVSRALAAATTSMNAEEVRAAVSVFERLSSIEGEQDGNRVVIDRMRDALGERTYALYSAASFIAREENEEPAFVMAQLRAYEGDIDADIKADLELPKSASLRSALDTQPMSSNYKSEILNTMRIMKARGQKITEDTVSSIIDRYTKGMAKDEAVLGPYIGDQTVYARRSYLSQREILQNRDALTDALAQSDQFQSLLRGGTTADAMIEMLMPNVARNSRVVFQSIFGGMEAAEEELDAKRIATNLQAIGTELKYQPIVSSFNNGTPAWTVGYTNAYGAFEPIIINDTPWVLRKDLGPSRDRSDMLFQSKQELVTALNSNAPKADTSRLMLKQLASTPHMSADTIQQMPEFSEIKRVLGNDWLNVYEDFRRQYEELPE